MNCTNSGGDAPSSDPMGLQLGADLFAGRRLAGRRGGKTIRGLGIGSEAARLLAPARRLVMTVRHRVRGDLSSPPSVAGPSPVSIDVTAEA